MSFFDGTMPLKVTKPIRLIELFAGIGAQAKALENLDADFERYRICEIEKSVVDSYNAVHGTFFYAHGYHEAPCRRFGDTRCVHMTYLQLSLAGVPAIVKHQNSLTRELWSVWKTPAFIFQYPRFYQYENIIEKKE